MIIVAGTITIDPADAAVLAGAAATMMAATHDEPGNIEYVFSISVADPGTVQVFEVWESLADLETHFTLPHMADFQKALAGATVTGRNLMRYEVSDATPL